VYNTITTVNETFPFLDIIQPSTSAVELYNEFKSYTNTKIYLPTNILTKESFHVVVNQLVGQMHVNCRYFRVGGVNYYDINLAQKLRHPFITMQLGLLQQTLNPTTLVNNLSHFMDTMAIMTLTSHQTTTFVTPQYGGVVIDNRYICDVGVLSGLGSQYLSDLIILMSSEDYKTFTEFQQVQSLSLKTQQIADRLLQNLHGATSLHNPIDTLNWGSALRNLNTYLVALNQMANEWKIGAIVQQIPRGVSPVFQIITDVKMVVGLDGKYALHATIYHASPETMAAITVEKCPNLKSLVSYWNYMRLIHPLGGGAANN
jgi:hypothetical protein